MTSRSKLNPLAPEYRPLPPGITGPSQPAFFFHAPSSTALEPPRLPQLMYYYRDPQNPVARNPPLPPPPPPPQVEVVTQYGRPGIGSFAKKRGGFPAAEVRERERDSRRSTLEKSGRGRQNHSVKKSARFWREEENRHKVMPLKRNEEKTTVMIKNIPYNCPRKELISLLDEFCALENAKGKNEGTSKAADEGHFRSAYAYDFLYLPIDFRTRKSRGFAFVNFTSCKAVWKFFEGFHLRKWDFFERDVNKWPKKIEIVCAKIQGKEGLAKHFSGSIFYCETDELLPVCFNPARDGSGQPVELTVVGNRRASSHREPRSNHKA